MTTSGVIPRERKMQNKQVINIKKTKMTKSEIIKNVAKRTGLDHATVADVMAEFINVASESLENGESVAMRGFGTFVVKMRAARVARDINNDKTIKVDAHKVVVFRPSEELAAGIASNN